MACSVNGALAESSNEIGIGSLFVAGKLRACSTQQARRRDRPKRCAVPTADEKRFEGFLAEFEPAIAELGRAAVAWLRARLPGADVMIYDNYNFLVAGFCPNERASDAVFSIALAARGVNLCFLQGAKLPDPAALLRGSGNVVLTIRLASMADFDQAAVASLIEAAVARAKVPFDPSRSGRFYVKSVSPKKRPRRAN